MPKTLNQIVCLMLDISLWTGRKKLELSDLKNVDRTQIPPDKLASLGSKRIVDPAKLKIFNTLKKRADRACRAVGSRFLGGYAIPVSALDSLVDDLEAIKKDFYQAQADFVLSYDDAVEEWIKENPEWAGTIRSSVDPLSVIQRRISFNFQAFKVENLGDAFAPEAKQGLQDVVEGLGGQLLHEISQQAQEAWGQSYAGRVSVGQKALRPLAAMADKLEGLSFVDGRVSIMAQSIRDCLNSLPKNGVIENQDFNAVCGVLSMLMDPKNIVRQPTQNWSLPENSPEENIPAPEMDDPSLLSGEQTETLAFGCSW